MKTILNRLGLFFTLVTLIAVVLAATVPTHPIAWMMTIVASATQITAIILFLNSSAE